MNAYKIVSKHGGRFFSYLMFNYEYREYLLTGNMTRWQTEYFKDKVTECPNMFLFSDNPYPTANTMSNALELWEVEVLEEGKNPTTIEYSKEILFANKIQFIKVVPIETY